MLHMNRMFLAIAVFLYTYMLCHMLKAAARGDWNLSDFKKNLLPEIRKIGLLLVLFYAMLGAFFLVD
ncbi:MAG: hypothetical protein KDK03_19010 [Rhodobacteraceae bacterium]|nr:hypothetical protein [Paracoccaceae bacterium]